MKLKKSQIKELIRHTIVDLTEKTFGSKAQYDAYRKKHNLKPGSKHKVDGKTVTVRDVKKISKSAAKSADKFAAAQNAKMDAAEKAMKAKKKIKEQMKEDFKNNKWEVYVADEKGKEKIVKVAKSKRAGVILYNKLINTDKFHEVGMRVIKEGKLTEKKMDRKKAAIILKQIGGNRFIAMTGAKGFAFSDKYMSFKIGRNSKGINFVRIGHNAMDTYDMEFGFVSVKGIKVKKKVKGVYADMLGTMFKKYTGMNVSL